MQKVNEIWKRKNSVKKVLLILLAVILLLAVSDIIMTKIYAQNIPHRFANAEDGRALMLANTDYYDRQRLSQPRDHSGHYRYRKPVNPLLYDILQAVCAFFAPQLFLFPDNKVIPCDA